MTQSHNANSDPNHHHQNDPARNGPDDEKPKGAAGQPLDRSGSFEVAQNPDAFFQSTIPVPTERGPSQPTQPGAQPTASGVSQQTASGASQPTASGASQQTASGASQQTASGASQQTASGANQPTSYMRTEGEPGMSTSVPTGEPGMTSLGQSREPGMSQQQVMLSGHETPGLEPGMYNPAIMNDGPIPVYGAPEHQALVGGQQGAQQNAQNVAAQQNAHAQQNSHQNAHAQQYAQQNAHAQQNVPTQQNATPQTAPQQDAPQQPNTAGFGSFFDEANRTAQPKPPIPSQPQAIPGSVQQEPPPSHSFNSFTNAPQQQPTDGRRVPSGFFDPNETIAPATNSSGTSSGTFHPAVSTPYTGGVSAQQAFFSSGDEPPAPTQPRPPQQSAGAFDSFTSSSSSPLPSTAQSPAQTPQSAPQATPPHSAPPQSPTQYPPHTPAQSGSSALSSSVSLNAPMGSVRMDPSSLSLPPQMESHEEGRELTAAELAQRHYDEYMAQLEREAAQPQPHFDPHERAAQEAANTERAAAEAIAQATVLSGGLGLDAKPVEVNALPDTFLNLPAKRKQAPPPEPPKRPRKVIPPPEPFYDENEEEEEDDEYDDDRRSYRNDRSKRFEKLMTPETKGVLMFTVHQVREILTNAEQFFTKMPLHGNFAEPALFVFIVICGSGLLAGIINFNLLVSIQFILGNLLQTFALSFVVWKLCIGLGSREGFEPNFRVIAYSQAALVIAGLQFTFLGNHIPGYLTLIASLVISIRLQLIGLQKVHELKPPQLMLVVIVPTLVILLIRYHMFLMQRW